MYNYRHMAEPAPVDPRRFAVLAADIVLFTVRDNQLLVRMMPVKRPPERDAAEAIVSAATATEEPGFSAKSLSQNLSFSRGT